MEESANSKNIFIILGSEVVTEADKSLWCKTMDITAGQCTPSHLTRNFTQF